MKHYDLIIIGSGSGLMVLEAALAKGLSCAIVERGKFGGTCLNKGCIPSKMLVYPADLIRAAEESGRIGVNFGTPKADWNIISSRMWKQINYNKQIARSLRDMPLLDVYEGTAEFTGTHTLRVDYLNNSESKEISADRFVVAAGARSFIPPIEGLEGTDYITSETFFGERFPKKPWKSLIIIGGGAIGAEFAHIFSALGTKITIVEMKPYLISSEEEEISVFTERQFANNGIEVLTNHKVVSASKNNDEKSLVVKDSKTGNTKTIIAEEIFIASGIRSNCDLLNCDAANIETDNKGWIKTNEFLETSQKHIYAIGDINGKYQFRHKANYEAEILIHNLFSSGSKRKASYDAVPWAIFTHPQVGHVGMTEQEAKNKGLRVWVGRNSYSSIASGMAMGYSSKDSDNGFVKIVVGEDKKILGVHVVGPQAAVLVQPFVYLMNASHQCDGPDITKADDKWLKERKRIRESCLQIGTVKPIMDSMVIHPSLSELTAWALDSIDWDNEV